MHSDLSEYNILLVPSQFVDRHVPIMLSSSEQLQAVLIDFGQAVDTRHPSALFFLERDLEHILSFFARKGVDTMSKEEALALILAK